jgi:16S rRNA G966 N2-methylase RsmD
MTKNEKEQLLQTGEAEAFFTQHQGEDPIKLLLKFAQQPKERWLSSQLAIRKKIAKKIPQWSKHQRLMFPEGLPLEQATGEAVARLKASLVSGKKLLDITTGMGIDAYYLSQSFEQAELYEQNAELAEITAYNLQQLGVPFHLHNTTFTSQKLQGQYDLIYADPARRDTHKNQVISLEAYTPNLLNILPQLLEHSSYVLIKASPMLDIDLAIKQLQRVKEVWVISTRNECKEVLFLCTKATSGILPSYKLFNIQKEATALLSFGGEEKELRAPLSLGLKKYLYEPNASLMKARATDVAGLRFGLFKVHANTNLLCSDTFIPGFPGKCFEIHSHHSPKDKVLKKQKRNVISRNYFEKADQIAQRLKLSPAKNDYLLAFTYLDETEKEQTTFALAKHLNA